MSKRFDIVTRSSGAREEPATVDEAPALTILWHPDARRVGERIVLPRLLEGGFEGSAVEISRASPRFAAPGDGRRRGLDVSYISRTPLRLATSRSGLVLERRGSITPAVLDGEPLGERRDLPAGALHRGVVLELGKRVVLLLHRLPIVPESGPRFGLVGESTALERLRREIALAAASDAPVLLRGATGTGKELAARAVHDASQRADGPWVAVNMAAVPPSLAASELFGSRRGAFTGADRPRDGYFGEADGGTLFLDEIGDTPPEVQPLLLRALEEGEIQPVGGARSRRVDVRVIAATDADLDARVADGRFRAPLLYRLAGFDLRLPTLAERRDDIGRLLVHFLERELGDESEGESGGLEALRAPADRDAERPWPPAPIVARLAAHDWPGNVRQLLHVARRLALARRAGQALDSATIDSLLDAASTPSAPQPSASQPTASQSPAVETESPTGRWRPVYRQASEISDDELLEALRAARFRLGPTAEALGVSRTTLYKLVEACPRVRKASDLRREEIERAIAETGDEEAAARALEVSLHGLRLRRKALGLR